MRRIRFLVSGDVQGVGFRAFTLDRARGFGLSGWVRNRWDGKVEGEAEGTNESLGMFETELRRGPGSSQVDDLGIHDLPVLGDGSSFRIER
jgi:acylphosphatase